MCSIDLHTDYPLRDLSPLACAIFINEHHLRVLSSGTFTHPDLLFAFDILKKHVVLHTGKSAFTHTSVYRSFKGIATRARQLRSEYGLDIEFDTWGWCSKAAEDAAKKGVISQYSLESAFEDFAHWLEVLHWDKGFQLYVAAVMHAVLRCGEMLAVIKEEFEFSKEVLKETDARRQEVGRLQSAMAVAEDVRQEEVERLQNALALAADVRDSIVRQVDGWRRQALAFRFRFVMFRRLWNIGGPA